MQNKKISIIIPTLQKDIALLEKLIETLSKDEIIDEILVIDNSAKGFKSESKKVKVIIMHKNIYVNPSWNLGIKNIKNEYFAIFNDDLLIPDNFCSNIFPLINKNMGLIGVDNYFIETFDVVKNCEIKNSNPPVLIDAPKRNLHWGTIIMGHKSSYYQIPEEILIWCGDDYLFEMNLKNNKQNYKISNCPIKHIHGFTSSEDRFFSIKYNDCKNLKKYFPSFKIPKQFCLKKRIKFFVTKCK